MNTESSPQPAFRVAIAMMGARRHYAIPRILQNAGMLDRFFTDIHSDTGWLRFAQSALPKGIRSDSLTRLLERQSPGIPRDKICSFPWFGLCRTLRSRSARSPSRRLKSYLEWNREFGRRVCAYWPESATAAYVFNGAGLEILEYARTRNARCFLDQTAAPWAVEETLLTEERERWPGWEFEGTKPSDWKPLADRESREWDLADVILCGSDYVKESVRSIGGPAEKCVVVPYGIDSETFTPRVREAHDGPLKVLFVGTIQLRKGIQYLMESAQMLQDKGVKIRAIGAARVSPEAMKRIGNVIDLSDAVPRSALRNEYDWADILVAPSISEGSANVCYEALASGLPVITTSSAGSVIRDGIDGFMVPIRNPQAIADRLSMLASDHALLGRLSTNAVQRATDFTWHKYCERLIEAITR